MSAFEALLRRCQEEDAEALEELIRRWELKLFYYLRRLVSQEQDAWDILQETWVRVLRGIKKVRSSEKLVPWMYRVARNTAFSHRKSMGVRQPWLDQQASVEELADFAVRDPEWAAEDVHQALETLSMHHREVLTLFFLQDLSLQEMTEVLEVPVGTIKSRLFYGKQAMAHALQKMRGS
jgi:RNA polymerase sigma-70 factor (ECF subfamily)